MVELVYFGEELCERAPGAIGCLYHDAGKEWVPGMQVFELIRLNMPLTIRPATESEMKRAEALAALYEIGKQIGDKIEHILDQESPEVISEAKQKLAQQFFAGNTPAVLLDKA